MAGLLYDVTQLRTDGLRLRGAELHAPVRGALVTQWMKEMSLGYPTLVASVYEHFGTPQQRSLLTLLAVELLELNEAGVLTLSGLQLRTQLPADEGRHRVYEHRQVWRCAPLMVDT